MPTVMKLPTSEDHLITLPIDVEDGGPVIEVTMPTLDWMPPDHAQSYRDFVQKASDDAAAYDEWAKKKDAYDEAVSSGKEKKPPKPGKPPCDPESIPQEPKIFQLRWLKPFCSDAEYGRITKAAPGLVAAIYEAILGAGVEADIEGESLASADS